MPQDIRPYPFTTADPRSGGGRAGKIGELVNYVTAGAATTLVKYGNANTNWAVVVSPGIPLDEFVVADPTSGLARAVNTIVGYVTGGNVVTYIKYGGADNAWCKTPAAWGGAAVGPGGVA